MLDMKVLFTTFAAKSHLFAQVPLAWAAHTAGHQVWVASQPDLADQITRTGLTAVPVGKPLDLEQQITETEESGQEQYPAEIDPEKLTFEYLYGVFSAMTPYVYQPFNAPEMIDDLVRFCRAWQPDLVVWDPLTFAGPVAARACGAAQVRLLFGLDLQGLMRQHFVARLAEGPAGSGRDDPLGDWLRSELARFGCDFDEEIVTGQATVDVTPDSLRLPVDLRYLPVRYIPYNGEAVIPEWLWAPPRRRRVALTLGVSHREVQGGNKTSTADLLRAVADLDIEVVATLSEGQLAGVGTLPANVRAVDFVPLNALLRTCSAVISHGGSGSFHTALANGVPQVIVPAAMWDERIKARRLQAQGAAICIEELTADGLRDQVARVLAGPSYIEAAAAMRTAMQRTPAPHEVIGQLERMT